MPGDVIYTISGRASKNRLVMEENERKQDESGEKAQIENFAKYQNGDTLKRERRYHARRNKSVTPPANPENSDEEKRYNGHGDALSTLPLQTKLRYFEDRQTKNSCVQTSPVPWRKHDNPCDEEEPERFQEIHKVRAELKKFSSGLYVQLPPIDQSDSAVQSPPAIQENAKHFDQIPNGYGKSIKINNNKEESDKEDYPCIVDCLYYSMQCCDCTLM